VVGFAVAFATAQDGSSTVARKRTTEKHYAVFISHSSRDRWIARQISQEIETKGRKWGIRTFLDERDIKGGDSIPDTIRTEIRDCDEFLVLLSRYSVDRTWVLLEIGAAWEIEKRIVAILDKVSPHELPDVLVPYKAIDLNGFGEYVKELLQRARRDELT